MTTGTYIIAAAAALAIAILLGTTLWSDHRLSKLGRELNEAKRNADAAAQHSLEMETAAAEYIKKIEYLEESLSGIERIASQQDEEIKLLETNTNNARGTADRARAVRRVESTAAELCRKLAEAGHPCE